MAPARVAPARAAEATRTPPTASATAPTRASPGYTIPVTEYMCAEISACSGTQTKRGPVYIWHADVDEGAKIAADIATDFKALAAAGTDTARFPPPALAPRPRPLLSP